jgi:hypothetical protein
MFLFMMSLDVFTGQITWYQVEGFMIQIIPAVVVSIATLLGFFKPKYGFMAFLVLTITFTFYFHSYRNIQTLLIVTVPSLVITVLLFVSSLKHLKK